MKSRNYGVILSYVNTILNMICGFFLSSFFVKMLGDTEYGLYQMITSFVSYLVLLEFGTGTAMTRNISKCRATNCKKEEIQKNISTVWTITIVLLIIIFLASVVFYCNIGKIYYKLTMQQLIYSKRILVFEVVYLMISFLANTLTGIVLGFEKYKVGPIISLIKLLTRTILLVTIITFVRYSIVIAIVDMIISLGVTIYLFVFCTTKLKVSFSIRWFEKTIFQETLPLCVAMFIQTLVNQANSSVDQFVIGIKLTPEQVSYYSIGLFFYNAFSSLTSIPISLYGPQIVKDVTQKIDEKLLIDHLVAPSRLITIIGSTVLCGFFVVGRQFILIFYGENYLIAWYVSLIIMIPMLINMSNGILINVLDALNKRMARSYVLFFTTIGNIILTVVWIDTWGVIGACVATAVCTIVGQITLMNIYYAKKIKIKVIYLYKRTFEGIVVPQLFSTTISFVLGRTIKNNNVSFWLSGVCYTLMFTILFLKFGMRENEEKFIYNIKNKLSLKK